jgi:hypothetical protein
MVDIRPKYNIPIEQIIASRVAQAQAKRNMLGEGLNAAVEGIGEGLKLSETVQGIMQKKKLRQQIAQVMATPDFQQADAEYGGLLAPTMMADEQKALSVVAAMKIAQNRQNQYMVNMPAYEFDETSGELKPITQTDASGEEVPFTAPMKAGSRPVIIKRGETPEDRAERSETTNIRIAGKGKLNTFAQNMVPAFEKIDSMIEGSISGTGIYGRIKGMTSEQFAKYAKTDPAAAVAYAWIQGTPAQFARGMGDVGGLAVPEQENAKNLVPRISDPDDVKALKAVAMYTFSKNKLLSIMETSGISPTDYKKTLSKLDALINKSTERARRLGVSEEQIAATSSISDVSAPLDINAMVNDAKQSKQSQDKQNSKAQAQWTNTKESRYQELMRKQQDGTLR